jgi:hypothetical protein
LDRRLIEARASMKCLKAKAETNGPERLAGETGSGGSGGKSAGEGRNAEVDFHGENRSNETHASVTDPDARLRKGEGMRPSFAIWGVL